jgi:hypothetical protein
VSRPPEFDELVDAGGEPAEEVDRLRRVHELLVAAGPPPELTPSLSSVTPPVETAPAAAEAERQLSWLPRRRLGTALVLAGAVLAAVFGLGYLAGGTDSDGGDSQTAPIVRTAPLASDGEASGIVNVGRADADGNWPMILTVRGLPPLTGGDYYVLALAKKGKPIVTCGTFNVADRGQKTLRMSAAYDLKGFDGWVVTRWEADTRDEKPVLWTSRA